MRGKRGTFARDDGTFARGEGTFAKDVGTFARDEGMFARMRPPGPRSNQEFLPWQHLHDSVFNTKMNIWSPFWPSVYTQNDENEYSEWRVLNLEI